MNKIALCTAIGLVLLFAVGCSAKAMTVSPILINVYEKYPPAQSHHCATLFCMILRFVTIFTFLSFSFSFFLSFSLPFSSFS